MNSVVIRTYQPRDIEWVITRHRELYDIEYGFTMDFSDYVEECGKRLGHKLTQTLIDFCKESGYKHIFLWTVKILKAARHIYKTFGFELTESIENNSWTNDVIYEKRWDLDL